ncbi:probable LRR receptor-like serine/threonine-protein kinase At3g47570 [Euphorbia lathyris]|uniref:probable LRR receptor-like serine/threonine-protein kinase At3g47570 n=1 Tax=Euphorbia lathyris TaxID=212925 RepID=UPI00331391D4
MAKIYYFQVIIILFILCMLKCSGESRVRNISTDRDALLVFKAHITNDTQNMLASNWSKDSSVCNWIGITCGSRHRRVTEILLDNMTLTGTIPPQMGNLSFLATLSLFGNYFHGSLPIELAKLRRLKMLDLGSNLFKGVIPSWIGSFSKLQLLDLSSNEFEGVIPTSLCNLSRLHHLSLARNSVEGKIPKSIGNIYNMRMLDLSDNMLSGEVSAGIFNISLLQKINLSGNWLSGSLPTKFLKNMSSLQILSFARNNLTGHLPPNMFTHLPALQWLTLSWNLFNGLIPSTLYTCKNLQGLSLSYNFFQGDLLKDVENLTMLQILFVGLNNISGEIPKTIGNLVNMEKLSIARNFIGGQIPSSIGNLTRLRTLDLSENDLRGSIPFGMGNLAHLEGLYLGINNLDGILPSTIFNISTLKMLVLDHNHFSGILPPSFGDHLPNLEEFYIGENNFSGRIPISLSNASMLIGIDLSNNMFFGYIPYALGNLRNLQRLYMANNKLSSQSLLTLFSSLANCKKLKYLGLEENPLNATLPTSVGNLSSSLELLYISGTGLTGSIPKGIGNLRSLILLGLERNDLKGFIPKTIGKLKKLQGLYLQSNKLQGSIPFELCGLQSLNEIYCGRNGLSGNIPSCLGNLTSLRQLYLESNRLNSTIPSTLWMLKDVLELNLSSNSLSGSLSLDIGNLEAVTFLDLSRNQLSGSIPPMFEGLQSLIHLSLSNNILERSIPESCGDAVSLEFLDLSINNLFGEIPMSLEKLKYLKYFNVSFNELHGEIPNGGPFKNLSAQSFLGNKALCGEPKFEVHPCKTSHQNQSRKIQITLFVIGTIVLALGTLIFFFIWNCKKKTNVPTHQGHLLPLATWRRISSHELERATDKFDEVNLLGKGSFGSVYKGILLNGNSIAVKVCDLDLEGAFKSFDVECEVLRRIRHRNLVKIITSCCTTELKALVMEFIPNWSLEKWLYSHNYFLNISQRLNIMIDVASALEYIHHGTTEPIAHCDLKPSNILLDEDMVAHVTDFGIAKLIGEHQSFIQTMTLATIGYMAPEYGSEGLVSIKGDIYSFGILLMETFTRRKPTDELFNEEMSMKQWIKELFPSGVTQLADPNLLRVNEMHYLAKTDCISSIMDLALKCCENLPDDRISSKNVLSALNKIKIKLLNDFHQT